ncbi:transposase [Peribacillus sp. YIM B13482]|uniref:transposase n=1 Tax=Peribacillus sp. YIM B13482 TaxID=3366298 RepID=UPI00366B3001
MAKIRGSSRSSAPSRRYIANFCKMQRTIERVFADGKEKNGMRWTTLRGLKKLLMQSMLTFAAMNVKKRANWTCEAQKRSK